MTARAGAVLYTPEILALAVELTRYPLDRPFALMGDARSRVCGSHVTLGIALNDTCRIDTVGARVSACAIGQASAALFLQSAPGCNAEQIAVAHGDIEAWLGGNNIMPSWPGLAILADARAIRARQAAILLPWNAALVALSNRVPAD